jgi:hypothetical protein
MVIDDEDLPLVGGNRSDLVEDPYKHNDKRPRASRGKDERKLGSSGSVKQRTTQEM